MCIFNAYDCVGAVAWLGFNLKASRTFLFKGFKEKLCSLLILVMFFFVEGGGYPGLGVRFIRHFF